jgi:hypothetical protein
MFCPNCGNKTSADQRFCRSCGLALEKIVQSLSEQFPAKIDESLLAQKRKFERLGGFALGSFGVLLAGFLAYLLYIIFYEMILSRGEILQGIAMLAVITLITTGLLAVYFSARAGEIAASNKGQAQQTGELEKAETTARLLPDTHIESIVSVTEGTTDILIADRKLDNKEKRNA